MQTGFQLVEALEHGSDVTVIDPRGEEPWLLVAVARGLAAFVGAFTLLNVLGEARFPGFDANIWWIDVRDLPGWVGFILLALGGLGLSIYAARPRLGKWPRRLVLITTATLLVAAANNVVTFYRLLGNGAIRSGIPVPFSLLICAVLVAILIAQLRVPNPAPCWKTRVVGLAVAGLCLPIFPFAQIFCFGRTDYRRQADVAVVLGARVYADGRPSDALADRVRTGCELYNSGLVRKMIFSGGPGDGRFHETDVMRNMALELGLPGEAIVVDTGGVNTQATVDNTLRLLAETGPQRILVVSHFYHLPRIKMSFHRRGCEVYTVPARESYTLTMMPYYMLREVVALWLYYLRPLIP